MTKQSEALRLADALDAHQFDEPHAAAAELRRLEIQRDALLEALKFYENAGSELSRLQAENENFRKHIESQNTELDKLIPMAERLEAQRDLLLEALCELLADAEFLGWDTAKARAAIKAVVE